MRSFIVVVALLITACGAGANSAAVGGECTTDKDCDLICSKDGAFGTGMCTQGCDTDNDCPSGAICIDKADGICAVSCEIADDCADFGRGFTCKDAKRKSGGETLICRTT